jgi:hypothetical protein
MPTPICENDATEHDKMTTASISQRFMARSLCINLSPKVSTQAAGTDPAQTPIVPQTLAFGPFTFLPCKP